MSAATVSSPQRQPLLSKATKIVTVGSLTLCFVVLEIVIGYVSGSLALVADAFHALSDFLALVIGYYAVKLARSTGPGLPNQSVGSHNKALKEEEQQIVRHRLFQQMTFGLQRAEVLGALVNAVFLLSLSFSLLVQAIERFFSIASEGSGELTNPRLVLIVGCAGLALNLFGMVLFADSPHSHSHSHSHGDHEHAHGDHAHGGKDMNSYGIFLHVTGDALGSVAVIVSALVVWLAEGSWRFYFDPAISIVFTIIIACTTIPLIVRTAKIMLLATPSTVSMPELKKAILNVDGVLDLHEVHVFELKSGVLVASLHVVIEDRDSRSVTAHFRSGVSGAVVWCESPECSDTACGKCVSGKLAVSAGLDGAAKPANYNDTVALGIRLALHRFGIHATTIQPEFVRAVPTKDGSNRVRLRYVPAHDNENEDSHDHSGQAVLSAHLHHHHPSLDETTEESGLATLAGMPIPIDSLELVEPTEPIDLVAEVSCLMRCPATNMNSARPTSPTAEAERAGSPDGTGVGGSDMDCELTLACGNDLLCCEPGISERGRLRALEEAERSLALRKNAVRAGSASAAKRDLAEAGNMGHGE